jgi:serine/threonine protein kinase
MATDMRLLVAVQEIEQLRLMLRRLQLEKTGADERQRQAVLSLRELEVRQKRAQAVNEDEIHDLSETLDLERQATRRLRTSAQDLQVSHDRLESSVINKDKELNNMAVRLHNQELALVELRERQREIDEQQALKTALNALRMQQAEREMFVLPYVHTTGHWDQVPFWMLAGGSERSLMLAAYGAGVGLATVQTPPPDSSLGLMLSGNSKEEGVLGSGATGLVLRVALNDTNLKRQFVDSRPLYEYFDPFTKRWYRPKTLACKIGINYGDPAREGRIHMRLYDAARQSPNFVVPFVAFRLAGIPPVAPPTISTPPLVEVFEDFVKGLTSKDKIRLRAHRLQLLLLEEVEMDPLKYFRAQRKTIFEERTYYFWRFRAFMLQCVLSLGTLHERARYIHRDFNNKNLMISRGARRAFPLYEVTVNKDGRLVDRYDLIPMDATFVKTEEGVVRDDDDGFFIVKMIDFARAVPWDPERRKPIKELSPLTALYERPPEHIVPTGIHGDFWFSDKTDVYSLGSILLSNLLHVPHFTFAGTSGEQSSFLLKSLPEGLVQDVQKLFGDKTKYPQFAHERLDTIVYYMWNLRAALGEPPNETRQSFWAVMRRHRNWMIRDLKQRLGLATESEAQEIIRNGWLFEPCLTEDAFCFRQSLQVNRIPDKNVRHYFTVLAEATRKVRSLADILKTMLAWTPEERPRLTHVLYQLLQDSNFSQDFIVGRLKKSGYVKERVSTRNFQRDAAPPPDTDVHYAWVHDRTGQRHLYQRVEFPAIDLSTSSSATESTSSPQAPLRSLTPSPLSFAAATVVSDLPEVPANMILLPPSSTRSRGRTRNLCAKCNATKLLYKDQYGYFYCSERCFKQFNRVAM